MRNCVVALLVAALGLVPGCRQSSPVAPPIQQTQVATVADCVSALSAATATNDADYFRTLMRQGSGDTDIAGMIAQVNRSGMADNYRDRLEDVHVDSARLNYHDDKRGCAFQVDLMHDRGGWHVRGIYFCR